MNSSPEFTMRVDDDVRDALDVYAKQFFPKPNGDGNRTDAIRQTLQAVMRLADNPQVREVMTQDIEIDGNILAFIRRTVSYYLKNALPDEQVEVTHTLQ